MTPLATVLYEDKMLPSSGGNYPLHDLVMRMVEDQIDGETWKLRKSISRNPRKGIGNILNDVEDAAFLAGTGELYLLVDRDVIAKHLGLPTASTDESVVAALVARSDAPAKVHPYFLRPNIEGLLRSIKDCDPALLPGNMRAALEKRLNDRDIVFNEVKKAGQAALRACVRRAQPGIDGLASALALLIPAKVTWP